MNIQTVNASSQTMKNITHNQEGNYGSVFRRINSLSSLAGASRRYLIMNLNFRKSYPIRISVIRFSPLMLFIIIYSRVYVNIIDDEDRTCELQTRDEGQVSHFRRCV